MINRLPSFFVVGTQKAGTTTLHDWLIQQPDISLPQIKETHFFSHEERYRLGIDWYLRQFPTSDGRAVIGEIDPEYMFFKDAPLRMRKWIESPKIIFVFRNPIHRAFSNYLMSARRGYETLLFCEALLAEEERLSDKNNEFSLNHHSYMARGRYCEQITRYHEIFSDIEFLYIKFDNLFGANTRYTTYDKICKFIGINSPPTIANRDIKSNQASMPRSTLLRDFLYKPSSFRKALGKLIPSPDIKFRIANILDNINWKPLNNDTPDKLPPIPKQVLDSAKKEILILEPMTKLDLQNWIQDIEVLYHPS